MDVQTDRTYFTDMTITRMRFECYEMHRYLWVERPKLERKPREGEKKVTIGFLLARIQSFTAEMEKTYLPMLSKTTPLHALASLIYGILSNRLYVQILQKYLSSDRHKMPDRLRQIVLGASIMILEHSQSIEQQPVLSTWSWYVGALHQYHTALLVLNELYAQPYTPDMEQRAWRALDFVFELGPGMTNQEKTRAVLEELIRKLQVYGRIKRWRAPKDMPHTGPRTHTPGYQLQQQRAEEQARHNSMQSVAGGDVRASFGSTSPPGVQMSPPPPQLSQQPLRPPSLHQTPSQSSGSGSISFPGAMPNADWGTFDMPLPASISTFPSTSPDMHTMPNIPTVTPSSNLQPPTRMMSQGSNSASMTSPRTTLSPGAPTGTAGTSPMDALNDIDWVSACNMLTELKKPVD